MILVGRRLGAVDYPRRVVLRRIPSGETVGAAASAVLRRGGREFVLVRLDSGEHALALTSETPTWRWPDPGDTPFPVVLYRGVADRSARREVTRMLDSQRRDALFKAEVLPPE